MFLNKLVSKLRTNVSKYLPKDVSIWNVSFKNEISGGYTVELTCNGKYSKHSYGMGLPSDREVCIVTKSMVKSMGGVNAKKGIRKRMERKVRKRFI